MSSKKSTLPVFQMKAHNPVKGARMKQFVDSAILSAKKAVDADGKGNYPQATIHYDRAIADIRMAISVADEDKKPVLKNMVAKYSARAKVLRGADEKTVAAAMEAAEAVQVNEDLNKGFQALIDEMELSTRHESFSEQEDMVMKVLKYAESHKGDIYEEKVKRAHEIALPILKQMTAEAKAGRGSAPASAAGALRAVGVVGGGSKRRRCKSSKKRKSAKCKATKRKNTKKKSKKKTKKRKRSKNRSKSRR